MEKIFLNGEVKNIYFADKKQVKCPVKLNRSYINKKLNQINKTNISKKENQRQTLKLIKDIFLKGKNIIKDNFFKNKLGAECVASQTYLVDQIIKIIFENKVSLLNYSSKKTPSVIAVGGYGRGELFPYSDIDIMFLISDKKEKSEEIFIKEILYFLWDLGLKIGHSTRTTKETLNDVNDDIHFETAFLENRYISGNFKSYRILLEKFNIYKSKKISLFINKKLREQETRHLKHGGTKYILEPNIKEGKGALRDIHNLFWITKYAYIDNKFLKITSKNFFWLKEKNRIFTAQAFLWKIRVFLHYSSQRQDDNLTFDKQENIAKHLNYRDSQNKFGVEKFMDKFFLVLKDIGILTNIFSSEIEDLFIKKTLTKKIDLKKLEPFVLLNNKLSFQENLFENIKKEPFSLVKIFYIAQKFSLEIQPKTLHFLWKNKNLIHKKLNEFESIKQLLLKIILTKKNPDHWLRRMNECGILGRIIPEFKKIVGQMQYDMYHAYTVDEHIIRGIQYLKMLEKGHLKSVAPLGSALIKEVQNRKALYFAILFHDVGKAGNQDHSIAGAQIVNNFFSSLNLSNEEKNLVEWLVKNHLLMSNVAFNYDIYEPKTIEDFSKKIQSLEKLKLLLVFTVADILSVGPNVWNAWKASLMRQLYFYTEKVMLGENPYHVVNSNPEDLKKALKAKFKSWKKESLEKQINLFPKKYWMTFNLETTFWHFKNINFDFNDINSNVFFRTIEKKLVTELVVSTNDEIGLVSKITGIITSLGIDIVTARVFTLNNNYSLDCFWLQEKANYVKDKEKLAKIKYSLDNNLKLENKTFQNVKKISKRHKGFNFNNQVLIDNSISEDHTIIEVSGQDSPGLLYYLTEKLNKLKINIQSASVSTFGDKAIDVFYIKDDNGNKINDVEKIKNIHKQLDQTINNVFKV